MSTNPSIEKGHTAINQLKEFSSSLDNWKFSQEKEKTKIYTRSFEGKPIPAIRGDYLLEGDYSLSEVITSAFFPGSRKMWDDRFGDSETIEFYGKFDTISWFSLKVPWPLTPRDFASSTVVEFSDTVIYGVLTSVEDPRIPEKKDFTRGDLSLSGWKIEKVEKGIMITYITLVDLKGNIPTYILKPALQALGLCSRKLADYVQKYSSPPCSFDVTADLKTETFDHNKRKYTAMLEGNGSAKWSVSKKMYPGGFKVEVSPNNVLFEVNGQEVIVKDVAGSAQVTIAKV
ncbi:hypothetical protein BY458DRAFT_581555 [Sporodiniella umbellata]|nr:hypothetical protein BY458DRAFT_581555 [Sporodiniella umbellata]